MSGRYARTRDMPRPPRKTQAARRVSRRRLALTTVLLSFAAYGPGSLAAPPTPTVVTFEGRSLGLTSSRTVAELLASEGRTPRSGSLLSLHGNVLRPDLVPPLILRNGEPADERTRLTPGDDVEVHDGVDVTERAVTETIAAGGNPMYLVGEGTVTIRRGIRSGEVEPLAISPAAGAPVVALTFDDGPHPEWTPRILDVLKAKGVKATFFCVGQMASRYPDLVRRVVGEGMAVGNHTWGHARLARRDQGHVQSELARGRDVLTSLGAGVSTFRPPYGSYDTSAVSVGAALGMRTVVWTIDSQDYRRPGPEAIFQRIMDTVRPGSIILMHDGGGDRLQTLAALPTLIDALRARGYTFATVG